MGVPLLPLLMLLPALFAVSVPLQAQGRFRLVAYNCENLFDTVHDKGKDDLAFVPASVRKWNSMKYWRKLKQVSKAVMAAGEGLLPDIVALCEVENDSCLHDLTKRSPLRRAGYEYVMTDSPDRRGIDVALLYQPGTFRLLACNKFRIPLALKKQRPTRDVLHVTGLVRTMDTLDVFVCHFPSRAGGRKSSEPFRRHVAAFVREKADSVVARRKSPRVVLTGDFNDEPSDFSLQVFSDGYRLLTGDTIRGSFHPREVKGSYYYKGRWNRLDHIMVNASFYELRSGFRLLNPVRGRIHDFPFLLEENKAYGAFVPFSFYKGLRYNGGYSDHLPVSVDFVYE